jgi:hypothetical protein
VLQELSLPVKTVLSLSGDCGSHDVISKLHPRRQMTSFPTHVTPALSPQPFLLLGQAQRDDHQVYTPIFAYFYENSIVYVLDMVCKKAVLPYFRVLSQQF